MTALGKNSCPLLSLRLILFSILLLTYTLHIICTMTLYKHGLPDLRRLKIATTAPVAKPPPPHHQRVSGFWAIRKGQEPCSQSGGGSSQWW